MKALKALAIIASLLVTGFICTPEAFPGSGAASIEQLSPTTRLHYTGKYCLVCHTRAPQKGRAKFLKYRGDPNKLCRCHIDEKKSYWHPLNIRPDPEKPVRLPATFPLRKGRLSCVTCHDIYQQCQKQPFPPSSVRGSPYQKKTDICFRCHLRKNYERFDPHRQFDNRGGVVKESCLYCHPKIPENRLDTTKTIGLIGDIELLCRRCHFIRGNHAGNTNHMIKPSPRAIGRMKTMEKKYNLILPLNENGHMTCATCHNPHSKGVFPEESPAAKGADSKFRQRLPGRLCIECHQK